MKFSHEYHEAGTQEGIQGVRHQAKNKFNKAIRLESKVANSDSFCRKRVKNTPYSFSSTALAPFIVSWSSKSYLFSLPMFVGHRLFYSIYEHDDILSNLI